MLEEINNELKEKVLRTLLKKALHGDIRAIRMYLEKYDIPAQDPEKILTPDEIINIIRESNKSETNNVID